MKTVAPISEQFKQLSKEEQADVFVEIQQIFLETDSISKKNLDNLLIEGLNSSRVETLDENYWKEKKALLQK